MIEEEGDFDTLFLPRAMADFAITRVGDVLSIWSDNLEFGVQIDGHFTDTGRVEILQFADRTLDHATVDGLAGPAIVRLVDYFDPKPLPDIVPVEYSYTPPLQVD